MNVTSLHMVGTHPRHPWLVEVLLRAGFFIALLMLVGGSAKEPEPVPGKEISDDQFFNTLLSRDSVITQVPSLSPSSPTWLEVAERSWEAPVLASQVAEDKKELLMGMGAVYIPYFSSDPKSEPDIQIKGAARRTLMSGKPGIKYNLLPGAYRVYVGSGADHQKIFKDIEIIEGQITPLIPDWSGLVVEVIDEENKPFRGEYEIARIDLFEPFGRGTGRSLSLGEDLKTWILKPGVYKIFGVGESYNTMKNFVTIRLLPGELTRFVLVIDKNDEKIVGGGMVVQNPAEDDASPWKYSVNVSGGLDFNYTDDKMQNTVVQNISEVSMLLNLGLNYRKTPIEVHNNLLLDENITITDMRFSSLQNSKDALRFSSLSTWQLIEWFGPYARFEFNTGIVPRRIERNDYPYYFMLFNNKTGLLSAIDSLSTSFRLKSMFSPFILESGTGANMRLWDTRYFESNLLAGIGLTYARRWHEYSVGTVADIDTSLNESSMDLIRRCIDSKKYSILFDVRGEERMDIGPELIMSTIVHLSRFATVESEIKFLAPFQRLSRPDISWRSIISWRALRSVTLDYWYEYKLVQASQSELKHNETMHRILLRFSYASR